MAAGAGVGELGTGQIETSSSSRAYRNLIETCRSPATRILYIKALRYFMSYLRLPNDAYDKLLEKEKEPKHIQMDICDFITHLRKSGRSAKTVSSYVAAIRKYYDMNDIELHWRKIHSFEGEMEKTTDDRPYDHSEIQILLDRASYRNRAIILMMASAGLRMGAIPALRIKDLEPIVPVMMTHGYRKFFETNAFRAGMDHMYIRRLMGQKSGLEDSYLKLDSEELLEGDSKHVGFVGIIDQLTIDESQRLKRRVETLEVEKNSWEELRKEVDGLKELLKK